MVQERVFICPGWPPPPYGSACGQRVHVRPGQVIEVVEGTPETMRPTAEQLAELGERDVLCRSCAAALLAEHARG
jgi:hypothetical protein